MCDLSEAEVNIFAVILISKVVIYECSRQVLLQVLPLVSHKLVYCCRPVTQNEILLRTQEFYAFDEVLLLLLCCVYIIS